MTESASRTPEQKVKLFRRFFTGLTHVYGTYDAWTGRGRQVKRAVTDGVILAHLLGKQHYGVYLLDRDRTRAVVADFDVNDLDPPREFVAGAWHYGLVAYVERSKSKGHHVWLFLDEGGVPAVKGRLVVKHILDEIGLPHTEVFPKHDRLSAGTRYGNYIYAPLFGALVRQGRTVFLDPHRGLQPYADQWGLLEKAERVSERQLDEVIQVNELAQRTNHPHSQPPNRTHGPAYKYGLVPCARRMLANGVMVDQRVACFRLAVSLKRVGLPFESAVAVLTDWAGRNTPRDGKRIITKAEITEQARCAFEGPYRSCGCEEPAVMPYCDPGCPLHRRRSAGSNPSATDIQRGSPADGPPQTSVERAHGD
jgi:hypothetical protein